LQREGERGRGERERERERFGEKNVQRIFKTTESLLK